MLNSASSGALAQLHTPRLNRTISSSSSSSEVTEPCTLRDVPRLASLPSSHPALSPPSSPSLSGASPAPSAAAAAATSATADAAPTVHLLDLPDELLHRVFHFLPVHSDVPRSSLSFPEPARRWPPSARAGPRHADVSALGATCRRLSHVYRAGHVEGVDMKEMWERSSDCASDAFPMGRAWFQRMWHRFPVVRSITHGSTAGPVAPRWVEEVVLAGAGRLQFLQLKVGAQFQLACLKELKSLRHLRLRMDCISQERTEHISACAALEELSLHLDESAAVVAGANADARANFPSASDYIEMLLSFSSLHRVALYINGWHREDYLPLADVIVATPPTLQSLSVQTPHVDCRLAELPSALSAFNLTARCAPGLDWSSLLPYECSLRSLELRGRWFGLEDSIAMGDMLANLRYLTLKQCDVGACLWDLLQAQHLEGLVVRRCTGFGDSEMADAIRCSSCAGTLKSLDLSECGSRVGELTVTAICKVFTGLRELLLVRSDVKEASFCLLAKSCKKLKRLSVGCGRCDIGDSAASAVGLLKNIVELRLNGVFLTNRGVNTLCDAWTRCHSLRRVKVQFWGAINDSAARELYETLHEQLRLSLQAAFETHGWRLEERDGWWLGVR